MGLRVLGLAGLSKGSGMSGFGQQIGQYGVSLNWGSVGTAGIRRDYKGKMGVGLNISAGIIGIGR